MSTSTSVFLKGLAHGAGFFIIGSIGIVIGLIPTSYSTLTVGAVLATALGWVGHYLEMV